MPQSTNVREELEAISHEAFTLGSALQEAADLTRSNRIEGPLATWIVNRSADEFVKLSNRLRNLSNQVDSIAA